MRRVLAFLPLILLLLAQAVLAAPQASLAKERRVALVIGNGSYKAAPLKNPVNDARDMAAALRRLGFEVVLLTDAGLQQMDSAVREFGLKLRQGGAGLFYYAGHGLQVGGENYLVPVNAEIQTESDVKYACVPAGMVLGKMEDARNDLNIIILDACRNNPFARSFRSSELGLAKMDAPTGSLISYATAPGSVASDGAGRNGLFTQHLLKNMATPGLPITEVFMRVRQGVVAETGRRQVPWEASSLIGQFYFSGQGGAEPPAAAAIAPPAAAPAPLRLDPKAEKKRLAEEAARLRQEQQELAQLQAMQAERDRLEGERQKLEQAKLLALAPRPKQAPSAAAPKAGAYAAQFAQLARAGLPDARAFFEQAVQARPDDAEARAGLAIALAFSGREADARYHLQRLSEPSGQATAAQTPGVRLAKGLLLGLEGSADAAYQFNRAAEEGADRALALLCQAVAAAKRNEFEPGQRALAEYEALVPQGERAANAQALGRRLNVLDELPGSYALDQGPKNMYTWDLVFSITRDSQKFGGTGTLATGKVRVADARLANGRLQLVLELDRILMKNYYWRFVLDISRGLDSMPVVAAEVGPTAEGPWRPAPEEFPIPIRALVRTSPK